MFHVELSIYTSSSANFKKDPPRNIFLLLVHAPATCEPLEDQNEQMERPE